MRVSRVILLLLLTLAVMRVASWSPGWLLKHHTGTKRLWIPVVSNAGVLVTQRIPGELIDLSALTFGVAVFTTYTLINIRWTNWGKRRSIDDAPS